MGEDTQEEKKDTKTVVYTPQSPMPKTVLKKILEVRKDVTPLSKDGKNEMQGYKYLQEAQVTEMIKPLMDDVGLLFLYTAEKLRSRPNVSGKQIVDEVRVTYSFVDAETGEYIKGHVDGFGADSGDKGVYKAITGAIKYIYMKTFLIPTGDDPEDDKGSKAGKAKKGMDAMVGDPLKDLDEDII